MLVSLAGVPDECNANFFVTRQLERCHAVDYLYNRVLLLEFKPIGGGECFGVRGFCAVHLVSRFP